MTAEFQVIDLEIPPELAGSRLDSALARLLPQHSRTRIKGWIEDGAVLVGRQRSRPRDLVEAGARIRVQVAAEEPRGEIEAEAIEALQRITGSLCANGMRTEHRGIPCRDHVDGVARERRNRMRRR